MHLMKHRMTTSSMVSVYHSFEYSGILFVESLYIIVNLVVCTSFVADNKNNMLQSVMATLRIMYNNTNIFICLQSVANF